MLIDNHVHIGWYSDGNHRPLDVWIAEKQSGVSRVVVASTSTCAELYHWVVYEMKALLKVGGNDILPILWLTPKMMRTWALGYILHSDIRWQGIKIHPEAHPEWAHNKKLMKKAVEVARTLGVPILLHTGNFEVSKASNFEYLFRMYPSQQFVLAHGRPADQIPALLRKYSNVAVDTAFMPVEQLKDLLSKGFQDRIYFGTDVPINEVYFKNMTTKEYIRSQIEEIISVCGEDNFRTIASHTPYHTSEREISIRSLIKKSRKW